MSCWRRLRLLAVVAVIVAVSSTANAGPTVGDGGALLLRAGMAHRFGKRLPQLKRYCLSGDIQASNYSTKQIAVVYDSDGSVTDLLLGSGASSPSS